MEKRSKTGTLSTRPKIIVITGAESTGKSTLAEALAEHYKVPFVPEFARDYIVNLNRPYTYHDVEIIARKQVEQINELLETDHRFVFMDTWLIITKIWFEVVFKTIPGWLGEEIKKTNIDLYLVCDTDMPWVADDVRENGGEKREMLQKRYIEEIEKHGCTYHIISGRGDARIRNAIRFIEKLK